MLYNSDNCYIDQLYQDFRTQSFFNTYRCVYICDTCYTTWICKVWYRLGNSYSHFFCQKSVHLRQIRFPYKLGFGCRYSGTCEYLWVLREQHVSQESIHPVGLHVVNNRSTAPALAPEASWVNPLDLISLLRKLGSLRNNARALDLVMTSKRKPVRADKVIGTQNSLIET